MLVTDKFMEAVRDGREWDLVSPKTGERRATVDARGLFTKLVETRLATGEPYIVFIDHVNNAMPKFQRDVGLKVSTSNLCSEITLPTGTDQYGKDRTAVCCLSSLNLEMWDDWAGEKSFIEDVMRFLDNVLQDYIDRAEPEMARASYAAMRERSVGLGVMGLHSFFQARGIAFEGAMAKSWNMKIFRHIRAQVDEASMQLAVERGPCPDAADMGVMERFSCKMAIAPTASISIITGGTSACVEPIPANIYTHKTLSGSFSIKNPFLEKLFTAKSKNSDAVWNSILEQGGSVQHLDFLSPEEKAVYRTAFEIDQRWLLELAGDRTPYIDQAQSLNLFIPADVEKWDLLMLHYRAWELGIKSLVLPAFDEHPARRVRRRGGGRQHRRRAGADLRTQGLRRVPGVPMRSGRAAMLLLAGIVVSDIVLLGRPAWRGIVQLLISILLIGGFAMFGSGDATVRPTYADALSTECRACQQGIPGERSPGPGRLCWPHRTVRGPWAPISTTCAHGPLPTVFNRHSRVGGNPVRTVGRQDWVPAFAGMTK